MSDRIGLHLPHDTGERAADIVASGMGSWRFLIAQAVLLATWVVANVIGLVRHWDPYPFILCNLGLSMEAAFAAPIIMMAQNRQATKDRARDQLEADEVDLLVELNRRQLAILEILHGRGGSDGQTLEPAAGGAAPDGERRDE